MTIRGFVFSIVTVIVLALAYNFWIKPKQINSARDFKKLEDIFNLIQFDNGAYRSPNLQQHYSNYLTIQTQFENSKTAGYGLGASDSLLLAKAMLEYWLWDTFTAAGELATELSYHLFLVPPEGNTNPNLPIDIKPIVQDRYGEIFTDIIPDLHSRFLLNNILIPSDGTAKIEHCLEQGSPEFSAVLFQDSTGLLLDPTAFFNAAKCMQKRFEKTSQEFLHQHTFDDAGSYSLKIKRLIVSGTVGHEVSSEISEILPSIPDSINNLQFVTDIYRLLSVLAEQQLLESGLLHTILERSRFEFTAYYLKKLLPRVFTDSLYEIQQSPIPTLQALLASSNPVLPPLVVLADIQEKYRHNLQKPASDEVNFFWYADGASYPPVYWWFDNYPAYLIRCYTIGYLDGGRLPLWVKDLHAIINEDSMLHDLLELAKYYNLTVFDMRNNYDAQNGVN